MGFVSVYRRLARGVGERSRSCIAAPVLLGFGLSPSSTESAVANGDTRTIVLTNGHTNESGSFTYMVDGVYDQATLDKLNWFLRDWRLNEPTKMDPKLFDIVWEVYRESGSKQPIDVLSGYRSPQTNAMLRRRSRQVAKYSQHMEGKAMDARFQDVDTATIRDIAMRMQAGGVGFYPGSMGAYRQRRRSLLAAHEPQRAGAALPRRQDGVHPRRRPADAGLRPGAGRNRSARRRGAGRPTPTTSSGGGLFSWLFGAHANAGGADDEEEASGVEATPTGRTPAARRCAASRQRRRAARNAGERRRAATDPDSRQADADRQRRRRSRSERRRFPAPPPPRKPVELILADAPTPPARPTELAFARRRRDSFRRPRSHRRPARARRAAARHHPRRRRAARRPGVGRGRRARAAGAPGDARPRRRARRAAAAAAAGPRRRPSGAQVHFE